MGITLDPVMKQAWREAGVKWKTITSSIVMVRLKVKSLTKAGKLLPSQQATLGMVISVYVPLHRAANEKEVEFFSTLHGERLLSFCGKNELTIINTRFQRKDVCRFL